MIKNILKSYIDKEIRISLSGGTSTHGILLAVMNDHLVMKTRWSDRHYIMLSHITSFWIDEGK